MSVSKDRPVFLSREQRRPRRQNETSSSLSSQSQQYASKRKQQLPRFHGAFTGGFSAGYFNTVGSKEGWKQREPDDNREQTVEDFMDDQDYEDWAGPTGIRKEYSSLPTSITKHNLTSASDVGNAEGRNPLSGMLHLGELFQVSHHTVGPRLLRKLGWREERSSINGSVTAYVPSDGKGGGNDADGAPQAFLSSRRLRKIRLKQTLIKLPPPKLDQCGLGFEPHKGAPEFRRHREYQRKLAQERARGRDNVYRASHLRIPSSTPGQRDLEGGEERGIQDSIGMNRHNKDDNQYDPYVSYETIEDFIGKKSVGGFALRDDEDDAYDDNNNEHTMIGATSKLSSKLHRLGDEYNAEIYEPESDDEDMRGDKNKTLANKAVSDLGSKNIFGGSLASWAKTSSAAMVLDDIATQNKDGATTRRSGGAFTSDGQPPLSGFVLGSAVQTRSQRFDGPKVPTDYIVRRHQFRDNDHPLVYQALSRALQLEINDERRKRAIHQAITASRVEAAAKTKPEPKLEPELESKPGPKRVSVPMAGSRFSGLLESMKNRFTTGTNSESGPTKNDDNRATIPIGLHFPTPQQATKEPVTAPKPVEPSKAVIKITRTVQPFAPHPLVCKRFNVPVPTHAVANVTNNQSRMTEQEFFDKEILSGATVGTKNRNDAPSSRDQTGAGFRNTSTNASFDNIKQSDNNQETEMNEARIPLQALKSIFEPGSESSDDDDQLSSSSSSSSSSPPHPTSDQLKDTMVDDSKDKTGNENESNALSNDDLVTPTATSQDNANTDETPSQSQLVVYKGNEETGLVERRHHRRSHRKKEGRRRDHRHGRKRSLSDYSDEESSTSSSSDDGPRKRHRKKGSSTDKSRDMPVLSSSSTDSKESRSKQRHRKKHKKKERHRERKKREEKKKKKHSSKRKRRD